MSGNLLKAVWDHEILHETSYIVRLQRRHGIDLVALDPLAAFPTNQSKQA